MAINHGLNPPMSKAFLSKLRLLSPLLLACLAIEYMAAADGDSGAIFSINVSDDRFNAVFSESSAPLMVGADVPLTVQVRKAEDFPAILHAGQRAAIFLDDLKGKSSLTVSSRIVFDAKEARREFPSLEIVFNEKAIARQAFWGGEGELNAFVPASFLESGGNVLQIRNIASANFAFRSFEIAVLPPDFSMKASVSDQEKILFLSRLCSTVGMMHRRGGPFIGKAPLKLVSDAVEFSAKNYSLPFTAAVPLDTSDSFFDPVSGEALPAFFALKILSGLAPGVSESIPFNLVPVNNETPLSPLTSAAVFRGADGSITCLFSSEAPIRR